MKRADVVALAIAAGAVGVGWISQISGRVLHHEVVEKTDAYLLPPPQHLVVMSLGHRAAVADILWANLLVSEGLRLGDRRRFDVAVEYLDAINELDPKWRDPYRMADSLVTLQVKAPPLDQVRAVRRIMERGVRERPTDAELWLSAGQFVGQIAPTTFFEESPQEAAEWREAGNEYLARAAELAPADTSISWQSYGGAKYFARSGRYDRAIEMYTTILTTTDDPELRAKIEDQLAQLYADGHAEQTQLYSRARIEAFDALRVEHYPGLRRAGGSIIGPPRAADVCAGGARSEKGQSALCAGSWRAWGELDPSAASTPVERR